MKIIIKRADELTPAEDANIDEVSHIAFSGPEAGLGENSSEIEWSDSDWFVMGWLDGKIVSLVGILYREVQVGDCKVPVGGIGGVATHPDYQRRGLASQLMERAAQFMRDDMKVSFGLLVCSDLRAPYYARLGWKLLDCQMVFDLKGKKRIFPENTMILPLSSQPWPEGMIDVCGKPW